MAARVEAWLAEGKLDEDDLDRILTPNARAWIDHPIAEADRAALDDFRSLVALVAEQRGGETGLVEWAGEIAEGLVENPELAPILAAAKRLTDASGFLVAQMSDRFFARPGWRYEGGADRFRVRLEAFAGVGPDVATVCGAILAALVERTSPRIDARFEGIDGDVLSVFAEHEGGLLDADGESRLHRAALVP